MTPQYNYLYCIYNEYSINNYTDIITVLLFISAFPALEAIC